MLADEELIKQRVTRLGLARTLLPAARAATISATSALRDTLAAPTHAARLPHLAIDIPAGSDAALLSRTSDLALVRTIGEGGMGRVHLARQRSLDRDVAVKTLKSEATPLAAAGLLREARLTGSLEHPGVIPVHALGVDDQGRPLLVMKRVEGVDWSTLLEDAAHALWSKLTATGDHLAANLAVLTQVCQTVEFAHSRGILHRDLKPENVMVGTYGEVYVVDWGIAAAKADVAAGDEIVGTPAYMAPEMALGQPLDERTDVYLLGATLHKVLTGCFRHDSTEIFQLLRSSMLSAPIQYAPTVPEYLAALCNEATARAPGDRPANARVFRERIAEFLQRRSALALSDAAAERLAALHALIDAAEHADAPRDLASAYRLATEARFGFTESLRAFPGNAAASGGLRAAVLALVELELRQEHAETAEALLRDVDDADPALAARIAELRARDDVRRREAGRLKAMDRDLDPEVAALPRTLVLGSLALLVVSVSVFFIVSGSATTPVSMGVVAGLTTAFMTAGVLAFRKRKGSGNAYNRKLTGLIIGGGAVFLANRLGGAISDVPVERTFTTDMWIEAMAVLAGAITVDRRVWVAFPPLALAAILTPIFPALASVIFSVGTMLGFAMLGVGLWPRRRPSS